MTPISVRVSDYRIICENSCTSAGQVSRHICVPVVEMLLEDYEIIFLEPFTAGLSQRDNTYTKDPLPGLMDQRQVCGQGGFVNFVWTTC